jgi:hypothetical protein
LDVIKTADYVMISAPKAAIRAGRLSRVSARGYRDEKQSTNIRNIETYFSGNKTLVAAAWSIFTIQWKRGRTQQRNETKPRVVIESGHTAIAKNKIAARQVKASDCRQLGFAFVQIKKVAGANWIMVRNASMCGTSGCGGKHGLWS